MLLDSQGQPQALLIKDQQFILISPTPLLSTGYRGGHLLHPALSVQEEECEAHRHRDAAGSPARYEVEAV